MTQLIGLGLQRSQTTARARSRVAVLAGIALALAAGPARARGGAAITLATTGTVTPTAVTGVVTITNGGSSAVAVTSIVESLEVRFPGGVVPPALPAGSTSGWYGVASVSVQGPGLVAGGATVQVPYRIDTCGGGVLAYPGAKDMRSVAAVAVTPGGSFVERSLGYALPPKCPVCGNGLLEYGEQCDGGVCCSTACRVVADGTGCTDGNACTVGDRCQAGACLGGAAVACVASDQCHVAGTCNATTGRCSDPPKAAGSPCDDGNACTRTDTCQSGFCIGGDPVVCATPDQCQAAACDPLTGACGVAARADGTACDDGDQCTVGDGCIAGTCLGGAPRDCNDHMSCTDDSCDPATGCQYEPTATCDGCDASECGVCGAQCETANAQCQDGCWSAFWACLNHCTTTYCAPFCQVDLGRCLDACPGTAPCHAACEAGNACAAGCVEPQ